MKFELFQKSQIAQSLSIMKVDESVTFRNTKKCPRQIFVQEVQDIILKNRVINI